MSQVTVICPGARRHNIKVTPNTVLLQVLEQACEKQRLDPALHELKHHGKLLDLSLTLRYSGVPNNGKLELLPSDQPRSDGGSVVVAVQTADGTRVQSTFHSSTSLWDVLIHHKFDSSPDGMEPSLTYMRQEVFGEAALRAKTLRSIGLSTGRGMLRLAHRKPECVVMTNVGRSEDKSSTEKSEARQPGGVEASQPGGVEGTQPSGVEERGELEKTEVMDIEGGKGEMGGGDERSETEPRKKPLLDTSETGEQLPYFPAHPFSYFSDVGDHDNSASSPHLSAVDPNTQSSAAAASLLREATEHHNHYPPEVVAAQMEEISSSSFAQFAGLSRPHPLATPIFPPQLKVYDEPCERETVVYSLDDPLPLTATEVGDAFFEHTVADVHILRSDLQRQAKVPDAPLMTRAMRAVRDEMKIEKYKKSVVRMYFPDRWVLQGCFRPHESLKVLVAFIRDHLSDPQVKFHLYTTPPKEVLRSARVTFAEAGFVPTAVVYVGTEEERQGPWLSDSALQHTVSSLQAEVTKHRLLQV